MKEMGLKISVDFVLLTRDFLLLFHPQKKKQYFGAPAICNVLIVPQVTFFIPDTNGTDKKYVETQAFSQGD